MDKTPGRSRRRQLFAAISVLGVSLGMAEAAHAAKENDATTQTSHKAQASLKSHTGQSSIKGEGQSSLKYEDQSSIKYQAGQSSLKTQSSEKSHTGQSSMKATLPPPGDQSSVKGETQ
jgi:hypothetical protein